MVEDSGTEAHLFWVMREGLPWPYSANLGYSLKVYYYQGTNNTHQVNSSVYAYADNWSGIPAGIGMQVSVGLYGYPNVKYYVNGNLKITQELFDCSHQHESSEIYECKRSSLEGYITTTELITANGFVVYEAESEIPLAYRVDLEVQF